MPRELLDPITDGVLVLTVPDLQRLLRIGRPTARRLAKQIGKFVGNKFLVPKVALDRWLEGCQS